MGRWRLASSRHGSFFHFLREHACFQAERSRAADRAGAWGGDTDSRVLDLVQGVSGIPRICAVARSARADHRAIVAHCRVRVCGAVFLRDSARHIREPCGWGDIAIGLTAPWAALKLAEPGHRKGFIFWNALGMLDLVVAVTTGTTSRLVNPHGLAADAMTVLPLSIVPTFLVPLFFIMHIIVIAQARRWPEVEGAPNRQRVAASAA